jgi:hypothetical protein
VGAYKAPPPIRPGQPITVMVFPFGFVGEDAEAAPATEAPVSGDPNAPAPPATDAAGTTVQLTTEQREMAAYVTAAVKAGYLSTPAYSVVSYHPQSSLVQRAQNDEILRVEQVTNLVSPATGSVDVERARLITHRLGIQALLVGTLESKADAAANTVEITLETRLINSTTGEVIRTSAVSGAATGAEGVPMFAVQERASLDAAQKALPAMGIQLAPLPAPTPVAVPARSRRGMRTRPVRRTSGVARPARQSEVDKKAARAAREADEEARESARRAEKAAEKAQRDAARSAERARRDAERAEEKARREQAKGTARISSGRRGSRKEVASAVLQAEPQEGEPEAPTAPDAPPAPAVPAPPTAIQPPAQPTAPVAEVLPPGTVRGISGPEGRPIPYGYAIDPNKVVLPKRDRAGLKVPAWLGVAGFIAGVAFLL